MGSKMLSHLLCAPGGLGKLQDCWSYLIKNQASTTMVDSNQKVFMACIKWVLIPDLDEKV